MPGHSAATPSDAQPPRPPGWAAGQAPASLYIHIPFCAAKCSYCDFASYPLGRECYAPYVEALVAEIAAVGREWARPQLDTVYIGGGTPTVLPGSLLAEVLAAVQRAFRPAPAAEVTVEANPGTVSLPLLSLLCRAGVNRLSLGVQSFQPALLRLLARRHSAAQAAEAVRLARAAGFRNLNLDLIYGLPEQSLDEWLADLEAALALAPEHLSLYALSLEPGTPLAEQVACRAVPEPDDDLAADMYEAAAGLLAGAGYEQYEISNWSLVPGQPPSPYRCRHNLTYWRNLPYAGCGAAAHSWLGGRRLANVRTPGGYIERVRSGCRPLATEEAIPPALERAETMILGLRLNAGVSRADFAARFGVDPLRLYREAIAETRSLGLLEVAGDRVRLTARGRLLGNQVFLRFLP